MSDKWKTIVVNSKQKLEESQAAEIIRRTDQFFCKLYNGNNHEFNRALYRLANVPAKWDELEKDHSCCDMDIRYMVGADWREQYDNWEKWKKQWGCLDLSFLCNDWISCAYIGGPYGWMSPNGEVGGLFNIGKYPDTEEVQKDLEEIAKAFPFLEFTIYLIDEIEDVVILVDAEWEVKDGKVELINEDFSISDIEFTGIQSDEEKYLSHLNESPDPENWWTLDELKELWKDKLTTI